MIAPELEQSQSGEGADFADVVAIDFCDPARDTFGMARLARHPGAGRVTAIGLLFAQGALALERVELRAERQADNWEHAEVAGVRIATEAPLQRWSASLSAPDGGFEIELEATSPPVDLCEPPAAAPAQTAAVSRYEHLCRVRGKVKLQDKRHRVEGVGRRTHTWGATDWDSLEGWRSLYAADDDGRGATVTAARPAGSKGHGDELVTGYLLEAAAPLLLDRVRLSTVYDASRQPRKAGLELYMPGDEFPRRLGGHALCGTSVDLGGQTLRVSFFRWSIDGKPAFGSYETVFRT